jgi:hypothetical protein
VGIAYRQGEALMLSPLQRQVAEIVADLPEAARFALSGGAALIVHGVVDRQTSDLDYFTTEANDVERLAGALERALLDAGYRVDVQRHAPAFVRLAVTGDDEATLVDLASDVRLMPTTTTPYGQVVSELELGADKLLALFGRAEARDFVDVERLADRFGFERLCQLAAQKDRGFDRRVLASMLDRVDRFQARDFGLDDRNTVRLRMAVDQWRDHLTQGRSAEPPGLDL